MKNSLKIVFLVLIICVMLAACKLAEKEEKFLEVYSFSGENEEISISNGVLVLTDEMESVYGGNLSAKQDIFTDITAFTKSIYTISDNDKKYIMSNSVIDKTGGTLAIPSEIGKINGDITSKYEEIDWENNLYFELKTVNLNGEEKIYQLSLKLTEVLNNTQS